jgi:hypothetical protein
MGSKNDILPQAPRRQPPKLRPLNRRSLCLLSHANLELESTSASSLTIHLGPGLPLFSSSRLVDCVRHNSHLPLSAAFASHAPIIRVHHVPEDAGWRSCLGLRERSNSSSDSNVSPTKTEHSIPLREYPFPQFSDVRLPGLNRNSRSDLPHLTREWKHAHTCSSGCGRRPVILPDLQRGDGMFDCSVPRACCEIVAKCG